MDKPTCATCPFFLDRDLESKTGFCFRFPPTIPLFDDGNRHCYGEPPDMWVHPQLEEDRLCGEHPDFSAWTAWRSGKKTIPLSVSQQPITADTIETISADDIRKELEIIAGKERALRILLRAASQRDRYRQTAIAKKTLAPAQ